MGSRGARGNPEAVGLPRLHGVSLLFEPYRLRELTVPNRAWLAPMCQYSAVDGVVGDWHLAHLGARAVGGFGLLVGTERV